MRLDLNGEVVRKVPVNNNQSKNEEEGPFLDITECQVFIFLFFGLHCKLGSITRIFCPFQVCRIGNREDMMLLCDRCDQGYHMDCLVPPLEEVPIEDWFCPQCDGTRTITGATRQRAPLTLRVRRTVQRNRQIALRDSSVARKTKKGKKRKSTYRRKTRKVKGKGKGKGKGKRRKKAATVPSPRKRLADALGLHDRATVQVDPTCQFSLFGNPNALDVAE